MSLSPSCFLFSSKVQVFVNPFVSFLFHSMVLWNSKIYWMIFFSLLIKIRSGLLVRNSWFVCITKSQRILWVSFFRMDAGTNAYNVTPCVLLDNSEWIFGYYKLNVLTIARITTVIYDFFYLYSYSDFRVFFFLVFLSSILDYRFPYCIQLYTWSNQQVRSSVKVPEFDKHLKKAGGHIGRNVVEITIKMKTIVRKTLITKINKLRLRNLDN